MTQRERRAGVDSVGAATRTCSELVVHALRSGDDEVLTKTESLMRIGGVRSVSTLPANPVALGLVGQPTGTAKSNEGMPDQVTTPTGTTVSAKVTDERGGGAHAD